MSGAEAGAEFSLLNSSVSTIPACHQLNSTSPFGDSGVDLNVLDKYGRIAEQISIENDDDVFVVNNDGKVPVFGLWLMAQGPLINSNMEIGNA